MTNTELTKFIGHYIEHDKTRSAIMLTAPWGAGKSYYIQNELIRSLKDTHVLLCLFTDLIAYLT